MRDYRMNFLGSSNILMFYPGKEPKKNLYQWSYINSVRIFILKKCDPCFYDLLIIKEYKKDLLTAMNKSQKNNLREKLFLIG